MLSHTGETEDICFQALLTRVIGCPEKQNLMFPSCFLFLPVKTNSHLKVPTIYVNKVEEKSLWEDVVCLEKKNILSLILGVSENMCKIFATWQKCLNP